MPGPRRARGPVEKVEHPFLLFKRVMSTVLKKYWLYYLLSLVCIVVGVFCSIQGTMFTKTLIDSYITPLLSSDDPDFLPLANAILRVACFYGIGIVSNFVRERLMMYVSQGSLKEIRIQIFNKMEKLPIRYFDTHTHGDIMSIYSNDVDTLRQMVAQSIPSFIQNGFQIVMVVVNMLILSPILTLVTFAMTILMMIVTLNVSKKSSKYFVKQQAALGTVNGFIEEMMNGQKVVKTFTREKIALSQFKEINDQLCDSSYNANHFSNILGPINMQLGNLSYVICAIVGGILAINGTGGFTLGSLASFLTFNKSFSGPVNQVTSQINMLLLGLAGASRIYALIDQEPEVDNGYVTLVNVYKQDDKLVETPNRTNLWAWKHVHSTGEIEYVELKGDVVFDDVEFGYNEDKMVLHDIDLFATPGQKIAFVGSTGAGKTTIMNLITRFYDIQDGKIRYDGININKIKKADLRHSLGMVLQDTHLFTATVKENIRYGRLDATDQEVIQAAKLANADTFIRHLPQGYDTMIERDGANLSQGQRQLLSIARAAIADPPVLILDEATSSIDTRTEQLVQQGMDSLMKGRTTFVIAHRLSTVKNADCIMVMEDGRIIERGNHDQLIEKKGRYYQLYTGKTE